MKHIVFLLSMCLLFIDHLYTEGFTTGTVVLTHKGNAAIEQLHKQNSVTVHCGNQSPVYEITDTAYNVVDHYIKISIQDVVLSVASDQKLFVVNKGWVRADELVLSDLLLCSNAKLVSLNAIKTIYEQQKMHTLSVKESHVYCVTKYGIIVHNAEPIGASVATIIFPVCPPLGAAVILGEIIALGVAGFSAYLIHKKSKQENQKNTYLEQNNAPNNLPHGGKPPKDEDDEDEHLYGIYKDASYHHRKSSGKKSMCPKNGQKCLDNSFEVSDGSDRRISIEDDVFVILEETAPRIFHGYIIETWKELDKAGNSRQAVRSAFKKHGLVNKAGKIIKRICS